MKAIGYIGLFALSVVIHRESALLELIGSFVGLLWFGVDGYLSQRVE